MSLTRCTVVLWAFVSFSHPLGAQENVLKDVNGDPLPPGAVGRLGKLAFRLAAPASAARYVDDGGKLLVKTRDASYRTDGAFQLFDAQSGKELNRIICQAQRTSLDEKGGDSFPEWCLSPSGQWVARVDPHASKSTTRFQWQEMTTGKIVASIEVAGATFHHPQFSPDGKHFAVIASRERDPTEYPKADNEGPAVIRMWDVGAQREIRTFTLPPESRETFRPRRFAFSPNGAYVAASGVGVDKKSVVQVWEAAGEKPVWSLDGPPDDPDNPTPFAFSPDGKSLAAFHDGKLGLWEAASGKQVKLVGDYDAPCGMLGFSPDGSRLLACKPYDVNRRGPRQLLMWDCGTGKEFDFPVQQPIGFTFSRSGDTLLVADRDQERIVICDGATGKAKHSIPVDYTNFDRRSTGLGWPIALSPDGKTLALADKAGQIQRLSIATGLALPAPGPATDVAEALAFLPDGKKLLAVGAARALLHEVDGSKPPVPFLVKPVENTNPRDFHHTPHVEVDGTLQPDANCVSMASNGQRAAVGWTNGLVSVWDTATGKLSWQARVIDIPIHCVTFAADDQIVISSGLNGQVVWWDAATGRIRRKLERVPGKEFNSYQSLPFRLSVSGQTAFGMSPDSKLLEEWELTSAKVRRALPVLPYPVDFSRDGRSMLVLGENAYHSISLDSGRPLRSFSWAEYPQPKTNPHGWCRISPNGGVVAGLVNANVLRFWDADTATILATVSDRGGFRTLAFAPDGKTLATANGDGTILLWRTPPRSVPAAKTSAAASAGMPLDDLAAAKEADVPALPAGARARLGSLCFQHGDNVYALRYVANGRSILAATTSDADPFEIPRNDLALWTSATGDLQRRTNVHEKRINSFNGLRGPPRQGWHVSPNGELLVTFNVRSRKDGETVYSPLIVQEIATGKILVKIEGETFVQFSPDSKSLAAVGEQFKLYDLSTGMVRLVMPIEKKELRYNKVEFSPDGQLLLIVGYSADGREIRWCRLGRDGAVKALPHRPYTKEKNSKVEHDPVFVVAPDSKHLAFVSTLPQHQAPHLILVEIESGKVARDFGECSGLPRRLVFSPDGKQLTALVAGMLERWEVKTGKKLSALNAMDDAVIQFAPDGKTLAVADGKVLRLHDAMTTEVRCRIPCPPSTDHWGRDHDEGDVFAFSADSKRVAVAHGRAIRQWDAETGQEIGPTPYLETVHSLAAAKDARWVATCSSNQVQVWDSGTGKVVLNVAAWPGADKQPVALTALALLDDGQRLAVGGSDGSEVLLHVPTGKRLSQLRFHDAPLTSLVFREDGRQLASADIKGQAALWDAVSGRQILTFAMPPVRDKGTPKRMKPEPKDWHELFESSQFFVPRSFGSTLAPDGKQLLISSTKNIELWSLNESPTRRAIFKQPHQGKFALSGDARRLVVGPNWDESYCTDRDAALYLFDAETGKELRIVANFPGIRDFSISPDGKLLAACSRDGLRIWDTATGTLQAAVGGHRGMVATAAFSPDGGALISAALDGTILIWDVARLIAAPQRKPLTAGDLQSLWDDLAAADAQTAGKAMRQLAGRPQQAAALLSQKLKPTSASKQMLAKLVADLDDNRFQVRESATEELTALAEIAEPILRARLAARPTPEQRRRVELVLDSLGEPITNPNKLRTLRGIEVLSVIDRPEAIELLRALAAGADGARETLEARTALKRIP
jgi:WD40 repeat protein